MQLGLAAVSFVFPLGLGLCAGAGAGAAGQEPPHHVGRLLVEPK